jgi:hypothetical protein
MRPARSRCTVLLGVSKFSARTLAGTVTLTSKGANLQPPMYQCMSVRLSLNTAHSSVPAVSLGQNHRTRDSLLVSKYQQVHDACAAMSSIYIAQPSGTRRSACMPVWSAQNLGLDQVDTCMHQGVTCLLCSCASCQRRSTADHSS